MENIASSVNVTGVPVAGPGASYERGDWKHAFDNAVFEQYERQPTRPDTVRGPLYTVCNFPTWSGSLDFVEYMLIASSSNFG